jgi:hypothetical protein
VKATFVNTLVVVLLAGSSKVVAERDTAEAYSLTCTGSGQESGECADATAQGADWIDSYLSSSEVADKWRQWESQVMRSHLDAMQARN